MSALSIILLVSQSANDLHYIPSTIDKHSEVEKARYCRMLYMHENENKHRTSIGRHKNCIIVDPTSQQWFIQLQEQQSSCEVCRSFE